MLANTFLESSAPPYILMVEWASIIYANRRSTFKT